MEKEKEAENDKPEMPDHVQTFDPEKPAYEKLHLCLYLRELEEEEGHK